jgi:hypothetical protein
MPIDLSKLDAPSQIEQSQIDLSKLEAPGQIEQNQPAAANANQGMAAPVADKPFSQVSDAINYINSSTDRYKNFNAEINQGREQERMQNAQAAGAGVPKEPTKFSALALSEFADQPQAKIVAFAQSRFPNMPLDQAVKRYGVINNHIVYVGDDGQMYAEDQPGVIPSLVGHSPTIAGNIIGGAAGAAGGVPLAFAGAGIGSAGGELVRNTIANYALGENKSAGDIALGAAGEGVFGALNQGVGEIAGRALPAVARAGGDIYSKIVSKFTGKPYINPESAIATDAASFQTDAHKLGLNVSKAEATANKADIEQEKTLRGLPGSAEKFGEADQIRNPKIRNAIDSFLDTIAPAENTPQAASSVRNASKNAISDADKARQDISEPFYKAAEASGAQVDVKPIVDYINDQLKTAKGDRAAALNKTLTLLKPANAPDAKDFDTTVAGLHSTKLSIDEMINGAGDSSLGRTTKQNLVNIKNQLVDQLATASPEYELGRSTFSKESAPYNQLKDSVIGKIADTKDTQLKTIATTLFDPKESDPRVLLQAKSVIQKQSPDAWNAITRSYLQSQFEGMKDAVQNGASFGKAFASKVMGTSKQREMLMTALSDNPEALENFKLIARVMPRLGIAGDVGSPTATRLMALAKDSAFGGLAGGIAGYVGSGEEGAKTGALTGLVLGHAGAKVYQKLSYTILKNQKASLAEAVLNPRYAPEMAVIRKLNPNSQQAVSALTNLLTKIGEQETSKQFDYKPEMPIPMQQSN